MMRTLATRARRALPLVALLAAACADGPNEPSPDDLDLLRSAALASDSILVGGVMGAVPIMGAPGFGPIVAGPPIEGGRLAPGAPCRWDEASARTECGPASAGGLTITWSFALFDAAGAPARSFGPTVDRVSTRSTVTGMLSMLPREGRGVSGTLTVDRAAEQTMSGLTDPSGRRESDGTARGVETLVLADRGNVSRVERTFADTTTDVVLQVPRAPGGGGIFDGPGAPRAVPLVPSSGRIVRVARSVETPPAGPPRTLDLRVVTEFLGNGAVRTTVTANGRTQVCTYDLLSRRPPRCR